MSFLIKNATIIYPGHELHNSKRDILIKNGVIEKIASKISSSKAKLVKSKNLHISPGWMDIGSWSGEPGFEHRESLESLTKAAAAGGYTAISTLPNTLPVMDNRAAIQYILNATSDHVVKYHPLGAISKGCKGTEITEMIDMHQHGAIGFTDGPHGVQSSGLTLRALEYVKSVNSIIIQRPEDTSLSHENQIHEGKVSSELGLLGNPGISESLPLLRDIHLNKYAESKLLLHNISSKESVEHLEGLAKEKIYCSVPYLNLCLTHEELYDFDTNKKIIPPLRDEEDRQALIAAVNKNQIQIICSNHQPLEQEAKKKEYVYAEAGAIGLQTCFSAMLKYASKISMDRFVRCVAINTRKVLNLDAISLETGAAAEFTLFDPTLEWTFDKENNFSKSKNSPFWEQQFVGGVVGILNGKKSHFNKY